MAAVLSPQSSSPSTSPQPARGTASASPHSIHAVLPPLSTPAGRRSNLHRPSSHAKERMSTYSNTSNIPLNPSRTTSQVFPVFHSSLSYTLVRDFAYPPFHPLHYGPPPEPSATASGVSTPVSEAPRRLSDPPRGLWDNGSGGWAAGPWGGDGSVGGPVAPHIFYHDGPPWSEDEDLQSPVVTSSRHKRHKSLGSLAGAAGRARARASGDLEGSGPTSVTQGERASFAGFRGGNNEGYYVDDANANANGPGGEYVTYPPSQNRQSSLGTYGSQGRRDSHFAATLPSRSYVDHATRYDPRRAADEDSDTISSPGIEDDGESRYSKDYQFTIASPDEEMHGKAVALFDFARENENELPLVEGQVIWVSYRHGQGWLVAEDPKTHESGLVPEEYVRLLRDIRGDWGSPTKEIHEPSYAEQQPPSSTDVDTPIQGRNDPPGHSSHLSNGSNTSAMQQHPPIVSTFSTSSKDLDPYPRDLLGTQQGQLPPQVVHYHGQRGGSQSATPTASSPHEPSFQRSGSVKERSNLKEITNGRQEKAAEDDKVADDDDNDDDDDEGEEDEEDEEDDDDGEVSTEDEDTTVSETKKKSDQGRRR
ncbi:MAG: HOG (high osmolarity glycerol) pathway protein [Caeruleum heppii]|nr:MAG: HOG (high osmolarity glycerol) pathway protein [Caeruleum heppii]